MLLASRKVRDEDYSAEARPDPLWRHPGFDQPLSTRFSHTHSRVAHIVDRESSRQRPARAHAGSPRRCEPDPAAPLARASGCRDRNRCSANALTGAFSARNVGILHHDRRDLGGGRAHRRSSTITSRPVLRTDARRFDMSGTSARVDDLTDTPELGASAAPALPHVVASATTVIGSGTLDLGTAERHQMVAFGHWTAHRVQPAALERVTGLFADRALQQPLGMAGVAGG